MNDYSLKTITVDVFMGYPYVSSWNASVYRNRKQVSYVRLDFIELELVRRITDVDFRYANI